jgi:2-C-methyl-D-erythritol 2,4-cyclodiphosphate synthase
MRIGHGFDAHKFSSAGDLILGGVCISEANKLQAHSDGDVMLHAVCDAILGAAALGDIGKHFPDTDSRWAGADSRDLLRRVMTMVTDKGFQIGNIDVTIIAQIPRLSPHIEAMTENILKDTKTQSGQINIKATTTERMGYIGREEGISTHAVVILIG